MDPIPPPDGPDINVGGPLMRTIWTLYGITVVIVALRLYTQFRITRQPGLGDVMMILSMAFGTGLIAMLTVQHQYGLGRHFFYLDPHQRIQALKFNFAGQPLGIMAPAFGRMATCIMMLQLFGTTRSKKWLLWGTFWQQLIVNAVTLILIFVQCVDVRSLWDPASHPSKCWSPRIQEYTGFVQGGINSGVDLLLTLLPMTIFWSLRISLQLKLGLGFVLSLSGIALVASIIKTVELKSLGSRGDFTFGTVDFFTWVVVEFTLVDIAASIPLILPLFRRWKQRIPPNRYELQKSNSRRTLPKPKSTAGTSTTIVGNRNDLEDGVGNSSEENIFGREQTREVEGKQIVKETSYVVRFDRMRGSGEWYDKRAVMMPWEAHMR